VTLELSRPDALELTEQIRALVDRMGRDASALRKHVAEARKHEVWRILGYAGWDAYVEQGIGITRQRAHQMLQEASVFGELEAAAGTSNVGLSGRAAREIAASSADVAERIRDRRETEPETPPEVVVREEVQRQRATKPPAPVVEVEPSAPSPWFAEVWPAVRSAARQANHEPEWWALNAIAAALEDVSLSEYRRRQEVARRLAAGESERTIAAATGIPRTSVQLLRKRVEVAEGECRHPVGRRIGDGCGACGQIVRAKRG
jgi:hypothetical protein